MPSRRRSGSRPYSSADQLDKEVGPFLRDTPPPATKVEKREMTEEDRARFEERRGRRNAQKPE